MTNPDFRALCANLTAALNDWQCRTDDDGYAALIDCARTALAEQPVAPTDEELDELKENLWDRYKTLGFQGEEFMYEHSFGFALDDYARAALAQPEPVAPTDEELWSVGNDDFRANCYPTDAIYFARAVLARWGQPQYQSISETTND